MSGTTAAASGLRALGMRRSLWLLTAHSGSECSLWSKKLYSIAELHEARREKASWKVVFRREISMIAANYHFTSSRIVCFETRRIECSSRRRPQTNGQLENVITRRAKISKVGRRICLHLRARVCILTPPPSLPTTHCCLSRTRSTAGRRRIDRINTITSQNRPRDMARKRHG